MEEDKNPHYASSSYSGADIKVIATLSSASLGSIKKDLEGKVAEEKDLIKNYNEYSGYAAQKVAQDIFALASLITQEENNQALIAQYQAEINAGNDPDGEYLALIDKLEVDIIHSGLDIIELEELVGVDEGEILNKNGYSAKQQMYFGALQIFEEDNITKAKTALDALQKDIKELSDVIQKSQVELGTVQTISCQSHRPKAAVRAIGSTYARGYTRGPRTIAGSMIFTVLNKQSLSHLCKLMRGQMKNQINDPLPSVILPDQLLPIDLTFVMANEYGSVSRMALYGVEFLNSGYTLSIEDLLLEEVVQFVARDLDPMTSIYDSTHKESTRNQELTGKPLTARETLKGFLETRKRTRQRRDM